MAKSRINKSEEPFQSPVKTVKVPKPKRDIPVEILTPFGKLDETSVYNVL